MNPMVFPIMAAAVYFGWNRYMLGRPAKGIKTVMAVVLGLMIIVYGVRMFMYYPNRVPYIYTEDNMLAHFYSLYRQVLQIWRT